MTQPPRIEIIAAVLASTVFGLTFEASAEPKPRFLYEQKPLVMNAVSVRDANGSFSLAMLPNPEPKCQVRLQGEITPLTERLWKIALDDA